jgi:integrative and conjugative element protein (TIGR02256 family)
VAGKLRCVIWRLDLNDAARESIVDLAGAAADGKETGGILLGHGPEPDGTVHVEQAGDPGPNAIRRPDLFLRDLEYARALADEAWDRSEAVWVGEWHTHLRASGHPSKADLATYYCLLSATDLEFEVFVSIIAVPGPEGDWDEPELWPWLLQITNG